MPALLTAGDALNKNLVPLIAGVAALGVLTGALLAKAILSNERSVAGDALPRSEFAWKRPKSLDQVVPPAIQKQIREADHVHAYLISWQQNPGAEGGHRGSVRPFEGEGYPIRSDAVFLSTSQRRQLRKTLLDRRSYQVQGKKCEFVPTIAYVFTTKHDSVTALISHTCDEMSVFCGTERSHGEVDPVAEVLVGLTHELFPGDTLVTGIWRRKPDERWWPLDGSFD